MQFPVIEMLKLVKKPNKIWQSSPSYFARVDAPPSQIDKWPMERLRSNVKRNMDRSFLCNNEKAMAVSSATATLVYCRVSNIPMHGIVPYRG